MEEEKKENENNIVNNNAEENREELERKYNSILRTKIIAAFFISLFFVMVVGLGITLYNNAVHIPSKKPIIYIYPEEEQVVKVKLLDKELLTCSYPKYEDEWKVEAKPSGELKDIKTGNKLYSLYYESNCKDNYKVEKEGFCVKKEDVAKFLEEKLEVLGLNYKEKEEFIVYWLPQLEKYDYVYIRFASNEEIENNMGLIITPEPETLIRIIMTWKGLDKPIDVEEQQLEKVERKGYTVVEWGGSEL